VPYRPQLSENNLATQACNGVCGLISFLSALLSFASKTMLAPPKTMWVTKMMMTAEMAPIVKPQSASEVMFRAEMTVGSEMPPAVERMPGVETESVISLPVAEKIVIPHLRVSGYPQPVHRGAASSMHSQRRRILIVEARRGSLMMTVGQIPVRVGLRVRVVFGVGENSCVSRKKQHGGAEDIMTSHGYPHWNDLGPFLYG